jgi:hypothetical protein
MDSDTLRLILDRFDKTDAKIDDYAQQHADLRVKVATAEGDIEALQAADHDRTVRDYIRFGVGFAVSAVGAFFGIHLGHYHVSGK